MAKECECLIKQREQNRLRFANIPEAFKDVNLSNFSMSVYKKQESKESIKITVKMVNEYLKNIVENFKNGMGLYIYSNTKGSGKTRLALSIANELIEKGMQVKFATSPQILNEIRATWDKERDYSESKLLEDLSNTKILIIDDFGTEKPKDWINDRFYSIINQRYINKKPTIFTSNHELNFLEYDDRITSRIRERVYQISFPEEDMREYIAEEKNKEMLKKIAGGKDE